MHLNELSLPYSKLSQSNKSDHVFMSNWVQRHVTKIQDDPNRYVNNPDNIYNLPRLATLVFMDKELTEVLTDVMTIPIRNGVPHGVVKRSDGYATYVDGVLEGPFDLRLEDQRIIGTCENGVEHIRKVIDLV